MQLAHGLGIASITAFGITCKILCRDELSLIFQWRNNDDVRYFMEDNRFVSNEVLSFWFENIQKKATIYPYIVYKNKMPCAYMEIKNINYNDKSGEFGIFLFGKKYFGTGIAERIALCWEIVMTKLGLKSCTARIHSSNVRSIKFFQKIGAVFKYKENNILIFEHELVRRRVYLESIAKLLGRYDEYIKYFGLSQLRENGQDGSCMNDGAGVPHGSNLS